MYQPLGRLPTLFLNLDLRNEDFCSGLCLCELTSWLTLAEVLRNKLHRRFSDVASFVIKFFIRQLWISSINWSQVLQI